MTHDSWLMTHDSLTHLTHKTSVLTLQIYFKQGRKFKYFCQIRLKYRKTVFKYWKYILNTLKSVSKYIWFGKGDTCNIYNCQSLWEDYLWWLYAYLQLNKLLINCQSDFRKFHSTVTALLNAVENWSLNIDNV